MFKNMWSIHRKAYKYAKEETKKTMKPFFSLAGLVMVVGIVLATVLDYEFIGGGLAGIGISSILRRGK